jgi:pimeloyl-CoA synthetase
MKNEIIKTINDVFDGMLVDLKSKKITLNEMIEEIEEEIISCKQKLILAVQDSVREHSESLTTLLKKEGVNAKGQAIEQLKELAND